MTPLFYRAAFAAIIAGAISLPAAAQIGTSDLGGSAVTRRGRYTVSGSVRDEGERPLESVDVQLSSLGAGVAASTYTNSNGGFAFSDVPAGTYYLVIEEDGYEKVREEVSLANPMGIQIALKRATNAFPPAKVGSGPTVSARDLSIPRRAREAMDRGMNLVRQKSDYRGSISEFQRAVKEYPQYYEAYMQMGVAYMKLGDTAKSEQALRTSIDVSKRNYADALFTLAAVYSGQKRFTDAEPLAREAVKVNAGSWEANLELARSLYGIDQTEEAEASALEALRIQPDSPPALLLLANIHLKLRNYPELIKDLDKYLELAPNGPQADQARQMREQVFNRMANIQPRTSTP
jgi:tetratricopeptide (TPR) repeat protein